MPDDTDRPQDVGRSHKRKGAPSPATRALLEQWHATLRAELQAVIVELDGVTLEPGLFPEAATGPVVKRPNLADRARLVDLGIKVGNALGSAIDPAPNPAEGVAGPGPRRRGKIDYGG